MSFAWAFYSIYYISAYNEIILQLLQHVNGRWNASATGESMKKIRNR
jgi:hypothetical protein